MPALGADGLLSSAARGEGVINNAYRGRGLAAPRARRRRGVVLRPSCPSWHGAAWLRYEAMPRKPDNRSDSCPSSSAGLHVGAPWPLAFNREKLARPAHEPI